MSEDTKQLGMLIAAILFVFTVTGVGIGYETWCKHQRDMTAIQSGLVQDKDGHWVKEAK